MPEGKLTFVVKAARRDAHGSEAACMIKGIERVSPILKFNLRAVNVQITGVRQDVPPRLESITHDIVVDSDESDARLQLLHDNVKKYGTVFNTVSPGT